MVYTGTDRQHDKMDREAADERAYNSFESSYIYEHLRPKDINILLWDTMWDRLPYRETRKEAAQDAKNLAKALSTNTKIDGNFNFRAIPTDWYENIKYGFNRYRFIRSDFIEQLVIEKNYPNLVEISKNNNHPQQHNISRHFRKVVNPRHEKWLTS